MFAHKLNIAREDGVKGKLVHSKPLQAHGPHQPRHREIAANLARKVYAALHLQVIGHAQVCQRQSLQIVVAELDVEIHIADIGGICPSQLGLQPAIGTETWCVGAIDV